MGAFVRYCGHNGVFVADIFLVGNANVVKANGPVTGDNLLRDPHIVGAATHHITDFPHPGVWCPERGFFVVKKTQVREVQNAKTD